MYFPIDFSTLILTIAQHLSPEVAVSNLTVGPSEVSTPMTLPSVGSTEVELTTTVSTPDVRITFKPVINRNKFWDGIIGANLIDDLTEDNFDKWVADNPKGILMIYATWCRYSKKARQEFGSVAKELDGEIKFGSLDCYESYYLCEFGIRFPKLEGFPTFYLFKNGKFANEHNSTMAPGKYIYVPGLRQLL